MQLSAILKVKLPPIAPRRQPAELVFGADQRPPLPALLLFTAQHLATLIPGFAYLLLIASLCGLSLTATQGLIAGTLLSMSLVSALNAWGGRLGAGGFFTNAVNFDFMFIAPAAVAVAGLQGLAGIALIAACTCFVLRPLLPLLRALLPPTVVGAIVSMSGLTLAAPAFHRALGVNAAMQIDGSTTLIAAVCLAVIVGVSVWGGRRFSMLAVVMGLLVGDALSFLLDRMPPLTTLSTVPWIGAPHFVMPTLQLPLTLIGATVLVSLLGQIYNVGCSVMMDKQTDADWRRPDMNRASRLITANGIADAVGSFMGGIGTLVSSPNLALTFASKAASRYIGLLLAPLLLALAFLPKAVTFALFLIPSPVQGAFQVYTAMFLFVGGTELFATRATSPRTRAIFGISICTGLIPFIMPALTDTAPNALKILLDSGYLITGIVALTLNLLFRLGTERTAEEPIPADAGAGTDLIKHYLEHHAGLWGVRRDVLQRAISAATEAAELIASTKGKRLLAIRGTFDEFNLDIEIIHSGSVIDLNTTDASTARLEQFVSGSGDVDALDAIMWSHGKIVLTHLAEGVRSAALNTTDHRACIHLHFDH